MAKKLSVEEESQHYREMVARAESSLYEAKLILKIIIGICRAGEKIPQELAKYLANCIEKAVLDPVNAQDALNLKKPESKREEETIRNIAILDAMLRRLETDPSVSKNSVASEVQIELALPVTTRQIINIFNRYKDNPRYQSMIKRKRQLENEHKA